MKSFSSILSNQSFTSPLLRGVAAATAVETANNVLMEIFGPDIGAHLNAAYLKNSTLAIACLSAVAAQEVKLRETEIIKRINNKLPVGVIKKIRYLI